MNSIYDREAEIAKIAESEEDRAALEKHLQEIVEGPGFRGSHRSGQFLRYVVDQAIAGHFESLKERVIAVELFGRSPSYDTSEDSIVRVTASDVRKRLLQHYGSCEAASEFRLSLPVGSYIPEITRMHREMAGSLDVENAHRDHPAPASRSSAARQDSAFASIVAQEPVVADLAVPEVKTAHSSISFKRRWLPFAALFGVLNLVLLGIVWKHSSHAKTVPSSALPWSALFSSPHPTYLITSDPDLAGIQLLTRNLISVSDYANRNYLPDHNVLTPEVKRICLTLMRGDKAANVDTQIAVDVAYLAQTSSRKIDVVGARNLQFSNLKTDDNFIFLGSPRTDPWVSLFGDQLDFRIVVDKNSGEEIIRNAHPAPYERPLYVPTAQGGATGHSFAIIGFIQNPDQNGQVLLLAGLDSEGTQAAGKLATDPSRLSMALQKCGILSPNPLKHFELLLRVNTMASSPSEVDVVACHILPDISALR